MNTPGLRPPRPNDDAELARFKDEIPLVPLATSRYGYDVTDKAKNGDWHKLEKGDEVLIVSKKDGHDLFVNPKDTKDNGSVIDFVKSRDNLNLGQTRVQLRSYLGESGPEQDKQTYAAKAPAAGITERQALRGPDAQLPEDALERRDFLLRTTLGVKPELTDRTFLKDRMLTDETIDAPAFNKRVFTSVNGPYKNTVFPLLNEGGMSSYEEKNHNFKSMMPGAKDGVWVSHATAGKDKPVEQIKILESPIDAMSKYQLDQPGGSGPNTMYIATSGNVTQRQTELIQKIIDRQQPQQVALASDNDKGGTLFNINYMNDLRGPRKNEQIGEKLEAPAQERGNVHWHATPGGKYHADLKVTFDHEKAFQGRQAVAGLQEKVDAWQKEGGPESAKLNVLRTGSDQTVVRLTVSNDQVPNLLTLSKELLTQREASIPEQQRLPANFLVIESAKSKDYNQDLTDKIQLDRLEQARENAGFTAAPVKVAEPSRSIDLVSLDVRPSPVEKMVTVDIRELGQKEKGGGAAQAIEDDLRRSGLSILKKEQDVLNPTTGERQTQIQAMYLSTDPEAKRAAISRTLDIVGLANGVVISEQPGDAQARRAMLEPSPKFGAPTPEKELGDAKTTFAKASGELSTVLRENGYELQGQRLNEVAQHVQKYPSALPLGGQNRDNFAAALDIAAKIPALPEESKGPLVENARQAKQNLEQKNQEVLDLGGPGGVRGIVRVQDEKINGENRAIQLWKDLKPEVTGIGNITERAVGNMVERSFPVQYAPVPGEQLSKLNQVLGAAERSPGISIEESAAARELRQQNAGVIPKGAQPLPAYQPGVEAGPAWITYAVTSAAPSGSAQVQDQTEAIRKAGASVSPIEGQAKDSPQQLVSFSMNDRRLGDISDAIKGMSQGGGNIYDVNRRENLGEMGGVNVATIRLTEAQDAARRTPEILDDLRANNVLIRDQRPISAPSGFVREEIQVAYNSSRNPAGVDEVFAALKRSPGIEIEESQAQQRSREMQAQIQLDSERRQAQVVETEAQRQRVVNEQQQREQVQQAEAQRRANDPDEIKRRAEEDRRLGAAILGLALADEQQKASAKAANNDRTTVFDYQLAGRQEPWSGTQKEVEQLPARQQNEIADIRERETRLGTITVREAPSSLEAGLPYQIKEQGTTNSFADAIADRLDKQGAKVEFTNPVGDPITGVETTRLNYSYQLNNPQLPELNNTLKGIEQQPGVVVQEPNAWLREQAAVERGATVASVPLERERPWLVADAVIKGQNPAEQRELQQAGATVSKVETYNEGPGLLVQYPLDKPQVVAQVSQALDRIDSRATEYKDNSGVGVGVMNGGIVAEEPFVKQARQQLAQQVEQAGPQLAAQQPASQQAEQHYPAEGWKTQVLRDRRDDELQPQQSALVALGAQIGGTRQEGPNSNAMYVSYHPAAVQENKVLETIERFQAAHVERQPVAAPQLAATPAAEMQQAQAPAQPQAQREMAQVVTPVAEQTITTQPPQQPVNQVNQAELGSWRTVEVVLTGQQQQQRANELREQLSNAGATVGPVSPTQEFGSQLQRNYFTASYQDGVGGPVLKVAPILEAAGREPGIRLDEPLRQQQERQQVAAAAGVGPTDADRDKAGIPPKGPGQWQQGVVRVEENGLDANSDRTARIRADLQATGASVGSGKHESTPQGAVNEIRYSYNSLQPGLDNLNKVLDKAQASPGVDVKEQNPVQPTPQLEKREGQFNQAIITIADDPGGPTGKDRAAAMTGDLSKAGAVVGEAKEINGKVEVPISYHTKTPAIQQINEGLDKAANSAGISVQEGGQDRGARLQGAQEVAKEQNNARQANSGRSQEVER